MLQQLSTTGSYLYIGQSSFKVIKLWFSNFESLDLNQEPGFSKAPILLRALCLRKMTASNAQHEFLEVPLRYGVQYLTNIGARNNSG